MKLLPTICASVLVMTAPCFAQAPAPQIAPAPQSAPAPQIAPSPQSPAPPAQAANAPEASPSTHASNTYPGVNTATAPNSNSYQLGPGDRLRVTVFGETDLTGEYDVADDGTVSFPLVGQVPAAGLTPEQFSNGLAQRLSAGYLRAPRIASSVISYRPFYILGEVTRPGTYPYAANLDVMSAVAIAGGFTYRANRGRAFIRRAGEDRERAYRLNETVRLRPGDTVRIGERFF